MIRPQPRRLIAFVKGVRPDRVSTFSERGTRSPLVVSYLFHFFFFFFSILFRSQTRRALRRIFPSRLVLVAICGSRRENFLKRCCKSFGSNERKAAAKWRMRGRGQWWIIARRYDSRGRVLKTRGLIIHPEIFTRKLVFFASALFARNVRAALPKSVVECAREYTL